MDELLESLEAAFDEAGYDIGNVSRNRNRVRVVLVEEGAAADDLRAVVEDTVDADAVLGLRVTTESVDGQPGTNTVVSFRYRG